MNSKLPTQPSIPIPEDLSRSIEFASGRPLSTLSTFHIGGPAALYCAVKTSKQLSQVIAWCFGEKIPYFVLGKGSNCLFDDRGFAGLVIHNTITHFREGDPGRFDVGGGYSFSRLGQQTARKGWSGLEFAAGIPGSVGGAIFMNAGANGRETCDPLIAVDYVDEQGKLHHIPRDKLSFSYRTSPFQKQRGAIAGATFQLTPSETALSVQKAIVEGRLASQPYETPSAGCIFRNPLPTRAGQLIELLGWKGKGVGAAEVSEKHANFIVNRGGATAEDVRTLIERLEREAKEACGIDLVCEVRQIPYLPEEM